MAAIQIQTRGYTLKEEKVRSLHQTILADTLVLENYQPFPGYFGENYPDSGNPRSIFIVLSKRYDPIWIGRKLKKISQTIQHSCYGTVGDIIMGDHRFYTIRIKNLRCFDDIPHIQEHLQREGIAFMRHQIINSLALIEIHKTFLLEKMKYEIYHDAFEPSRYYLPINDELDWDSFKEITAMVKNNTKNNRFDAAQSMIWATDGPQDLIRIYDDKATPEQLNELRLLFEFNIKQYRALNPVRELEKSPYFY